MEQNQSLQLLALNFSKSRTEKDFQIIYNRMKHGVAVYLKPLLHNYDDREEATSLTFSLVWAKIDQYDPYWHFSTWVYRIARNEALKIIKRARKHNIASYDDLVEKGVNVDAHAGSYIMDENLDNATDDIYSAAIDAINNLPDKYKIVMLMQGVEKKKYDEIAKELGQNRNTVKTRVKKGREIVESQLKQCAPDLYNLYLTTK